MAALSVRFLDPSRLQDSPWYRLLTKILSTQYLAACDTGIAGASSLYAPLYPFLNWADARIREWSKVHNAEWGMLRTSLLEQLSHQLADLTYKTYILEANILSARSDATGLDGSSAVDRFARTVAGCHRYAQRLYLPIPRVDAPDGHDGPAVA